MILAIAPHTETTKIEKLKTVGSAGISSEPYNLSTQEPNRNTASSTFFSICPQ